MRKLIGLWLMIFGVFFFGFLLGKLTEIDPESRTAEVTGKRESGGKTCIEVVIEVTPEEYIGLDIGDEYEVRK